ncbi:MAG: S8 family serine peptidase, partial [Candidatus Eisenbacteria bacterium]
QAACATPAAGSSNPQDHGSEASSYHATHVAGTIMGTGGPGGFFAGVAPAARLVDCKVLSDAGASVGGSNRGVDWVISNRTRLWTGLPAGSIWQGIDVVSMSLGSTECAGGSGTSTGTGSTLINTAVDAGLVMVIATGNDASVECIASPAAADKSVAVGASTHNRTLDRGDDRVTDFSNEGPRDDDGDTDHFDEMKPSVVAPGAGIISAFGDPSTDGTAYQQLSGTSMATPHVSGCAALILQANPGLSPMQVRSVLQNTAEHNVPTLKVAGDRGQDPFGLDANYDPSCGWGLVDVYAACKEALNSASGVQVVKIRPLANPAASRIDFTWITQREYPFQGFNVYRAPNVNNAPGTFAKLNASLIPGAGQPAIQGVANRTPYVFVDADPALVLGQSYWYRVDWVDLGGGVHAEPALAVAYGTLARVATAFYQIVHNAVDNDLTIRLGSDYGRSIGSLGGADMEVLGPGEKAQDSVRVILPSTVPANTGSSALGTLEHFWSVGFRQGDAAEAFLPPSYGTPWFLSVTDGGYVNRTGRLTSYSIFVNDSPGSPSGTTYVTDHAPMPSPLVEGGVVPTTIWIPEQRTTDVGAAHLAATLAGDIVEIDFALTQSSAGASARILRSTSEEFSAAALISPESLPIGDGGLHFEDRETEPGLTYWYWVEVRTAAGSTFMNGPVSVTTPSAFAVTFARAPQPNPMRAGGALHFTVGADAAVGGSAEVVVTLHDIHGRKVRELVHERMGVGEHALQWKAADSNGRSVQAGMYYLSFRAGRISQTHKVIVVD